MLNACSADTDGVKPNSNPVDFITISKSNQLYSEDIFVNNIIIALDNTVRQGANNDFSNEELGNIFLNESSDLGIAMQSEEDETFPTNPSSEFQSYLQEYSNLPLNVTLEEYISTINDLKSEVNNNVTEINERALLIDNLNLNLAIV